MVKVTVGERRVFPCIRAQQEVRSTTIIHVVASPLKSATRFLLLLATGYG